MGRPPMGVKYTAIRLSPDVLARIDKAVGAKNQRSAFIRAAVEAELQRREQGNGDG